MEQGSVLTFTVEPVKQVSIAQNCDYFLTHRLNICFGCSKEPSHMIWLRNKKNSFLVDLRNLIWRPGLPNNTHGYYTFTTTSKA